MNKHLIPLVLLLCLLSSCSHFSLYQDAKTIGKGNASIGSTLSLNGVSDAEEVADEILPNVSIFGSYGITNKLEAQLKIGLGNIVIIPKFQILGNEESKFFVALNPAINLENDLRTNNDTTNPRVDYSGILSYHPTKEFSIFIEPQYIAEYRRENEANEFLRGGNFGIFIRTDSPFDLSFGGSLFQEQVSGKFIYQFGVGFRYIRPFRK